MGIELKLQMKFCNLSNDQYIINKKKQNIEYKYCIKFAMNQTKYHIKKKQVPFIMLFFFLFQRSNFQRSNYKRRKIQCTAPVIRFRELN